MGLFKEIIVDGTFDGNVSGPLCYSVTDVAMHILNYSDGCFVPFQPIPDNVFFVAACNPHRGNSLASHSQASHSQASHSQASHSQETWVRGSYYVRQLHPTVRFLMWDYGSLDEHQERAYINAKMKMLNRQMPEADVSYECVRIIEGHRIYIE